MEDCPIPVFRNLLIADSGKGHVEEMVRMLQDIPSLKAAGVSLLHVVPEQMHTALKPNT